MGNKCLIFKQAAKTHFDVYLRGEIEAFSDYDDLFKELSNLKEHDSVLVHLNSPGGSCSVGFLITDILQDLPCPVKIAVEYPSYSMGAIIAVCGNDLFLAQDTYIMFHDYSYGSKRAKGGDLFDHSTNYRKVFKDKFTRLCYPFLSKKEIDRMFKGEDIYIHWDDPTLEERKQRHFKK